LEILPSLEESAQSSGGSTTAVRSAGEKRSGPLVSTSRRSSGEATEGRDREPLDLIQKSRQPSDRTEGARGLTLLTPGRSPDSHRDIGVHEESGVTRTRDREFL
jgi:hypothetical protein